jgi:DNA polymerase I-like protein with 3'-5' exonuclease and polymerase domains
MMPESTWRPPTSFPDISDAREMDIDIESRDEHLREKGPGYPRGDAYVCGVAVNVPGFRGFYPVRHDSGCNLPPNVVFEWLADVAKNFRGELRGAHLLYDLEGLHYEGVHFSDDVKYRDVLVAEPLIDEESKWGYNLENVAKKYLGEGKREDLLRQVASRFTKGYKDKRCRRPIQFHPKSDLWRLPPEYVGAYAEGDVDLPGRVYQEQKKILDRENLWEAFDLESSLIPILLQMRIFGTRVDLERANALVKLMTAEIDKFSMQIKKLVNFDPNLDSGHDVLKAYEALNFTHEELHVLDAITHTAKGNPSFTDTWYALQTDPLSGIIRKKKKLLTLRDDFVIGDIIKEQVRGRIHAQFHQLRGEDEGADGLGERGTRSGRMASANPNLQQVPSRHDDGLWGTDGPIWAKEVRKIFVAEEGQRWLKVDVSQQEPRWLVHFAAKARLQGADEAVAAFRTNPKTDYHALTTKIVNEKSGKNFKRKQIKSVNLAMMYSAGVSKLCKMIKVDIAEGVEILAAYHQALPFVRALSTMAMNVAEERGYITLVDGRRRRFNMWVPKPSSKEERGVRWAGVPLEQAKIQWPGKGLQRFGLHRALNSLLQGNSAVQIKVAMRDLYYVHRITPQLQVHDELNKSIPDIQEGRTIKLAMENAILLEIPVVAEATVGDSWGSATEEVLLAA